MRPLHTVPQASYHRSHKHMRTVGLVQNAPLNDWLALSIGNSRLHWAWFTGTQLQQAWDTDHLDAFAIQRLIINQFNFHRCQLIDRNIAMPQWEDMPDLWIVSVVPHQTQFWQQYLRSRLVTLDEIPMDSYSTLGSDRAVAVWGATQLTHSSALVIDCGTAMTFTGAIPHPADSNRATLIGGAILPGLQLQLKSLGQSTAALPTLDPQDLQLPTRWATNTPDSISSGVLYSVASSLNSYIQDWLTQYPTSPILLTGGDANAIYTLIQQYLPVLTPHLRREPHLAFSSIATLRELRLLSTPTSSI
jgi:type III pantothenate kinase